LMAEIARMEPHAVAPATFAGVCGVP
jgi:hypothetical protein